MRSTHSVILVCSAVFISFSFFSFSLVRPIKAAISQTATYTLSGNNDTYTYFDALSPAGGKQKFIGVNWQYYNYQMQPFNLTGINTVTATGENAIYPPNYNGVYKVDHDADGNLYTFENDLSYIHKYTFNSGTNTYTESSIGFTIDYTAARVDAFSVDKSTGNIYTLVEGMDEVGEKRIIVTQPNGSQWEFFHDYPNTMVDPVINNPVTAYVYDINVVNNVLYMGSSTRPNVGEHLIYYKNTYDHPTDGGAEGSFAPFAYTDIFPNAIEAHHTMVDQYGQIYAVSDMASNISTMYVYDSTGCYLDMMSLNNVRDVKIENDKMYTLMHNANNVADQIIEYDITPFGPGSCGGGGGDPTPSVTPTPTTTPGAGAKKIILPAALNGVLSSDNETDAEATGSSSAGTVLISFTNNHPLAEIANDFSDDYNWGSVTSGEDATNGKSFAHGLVGLPGAGASFTLFVPIPAGKISNSVAICPGASDLSAVTVACSNVEIKTLASGGVSKVQVAGINYWKVSGLTGTGGIALIDSFAVSDTLTRQKVATPSNHLIRFGTINGLLISTDTLVIDLGSDWGFGSLAVADIDLLDDGVNLTLAGSAGVNTWGVSINSGLGTITFTAPASGTGYMATGSEILIKIGTNAVSGGTGTHQISNPVSVNSYTITGTINDALGEETAEFTVPIVDSDQVNVTAYIDTFITFDLDTAVADLDCDFNSCKLFGDAGLAGSNYTVDLGELNATYINKSNSSAVNHSSGGSGVINSIYLNLTTNAINGAIVNVSSSNGALESSAAQNNRIESVIDGADIAVNSGLYGYQMPAGSSGNGTINTNTNCSVSLFCALAALPSEVFNTDGLPLDNGRVRMDIAAAAAYINNPGNYTDTLTFVAVPSY